MRQEAAGRQVPDGIGLTQAEGEGADEGERQALQLTHDGRRVGVDDEERHDEDVQAQGADGDDVMVIDLHRVFFGGDDGVGTGGLRGVPDGSDVGGGVAVMVAEASRSDDIEPVRA